MSLRYIRNFYGVKAFRGRPILFQGKRMKIISSVGPYLKVKDEEGKMHTLHPTWEVSYLEEGK